jgi:hypothetical protein
VVHLNASLLYVARFRQKFTLDDAVSSHACSLHCLLEASRRVTNSIPLGNPLLLPVGTVNSIQTQQKVKSAFAQLEGLFESERVGLMHTFNTCGAVTTDGDVYLLHDYISDDWMGLVQYVFDIVLSLEFVLPHERYDAGAHVLRIAASEHLYRTVSCWLLPASTSCTFSFQCTRHYTIVPLQFIQLPASTSCDVRSSQAWCPSSTHVPIKMSYQPPTYTGIIIRWVRLMCELDALRC